MNFKKMLNITGMFLLFMILMPMNTVAEGYKSAKQILEHAADLDTQGEKDRAIRMYKAIIDIYPKSRQAATARQRLTAFEKAEKQKNAADEREKIKEDRKRQEIIKLNAKKVIEGLAELERKNKQAEIKQREIARRSNASSFSSSPTKNIGWKIKAAHSYTDGEKGWTISCDDGNTRTVFYAKSPNLSNTPYGGKHINFKYFATLDEAAKYSCNGD
jgi:hypothetical protein